MAKPKTDIDVVLELPQSTGIMAAVEVIASFDNGLFNVPIRRPWKP